MLGVRGRQRIKKAGMHVLPIQFFFHTLTIEPYCQFNMKDQLYAHFEKLLSTADKPLKLTDQNFATKVNPRRSYPECTVNMGALFDEDGIPSST